MSALLVTTSGPIATVTLNRPERHNAFDDALIAELTATFARLGEDSTIGAIVLASTGKSFSAGADLTWMRRMAAYTPEENEADAAKLAAMLHTLDRLPKPTIALVQGNAYGGGVGLVACCDIAIAADTARFALTEVKLGLTPATVSPYVINAIGARQARRYFLTGELFSSATARQIGLVHETVPAGELEAARDRILHALAHGARGAQAEAKSLVFLAEGRKVDEALRAETSRRIAHRRASAEGREGIAALLEGRAPGWRTA
jgi:methylglutaconyl-CoA hydratase